MNMMYLSLAIVVISGAVLVGILGYYLYKKRTLLLEDEQNSHYYPDEPQFYHSRNTSNVDHQDYAQSTFEGTGNPAQDKGRYTTLDMFNDQKLNEPHPIIATTHYEEYEEDEEEEEELTQHQNHYTPYYAQEAHHEADVEPEDDVAPEPRATRQSSLDPDEELLVIYVLAEAKQPYVGYELLQALLSSGLRYGEMNIFHRFERAHGRGTPLFSLASASEPGTFDLNKMGEVSCRGLCLFLHLDEVKDPIIAFERMVDTANQLVEDLGGDVRDARGQVFNNDRLIDYRERVRDYVVAHHSKQHEEIVT
jgi:cell division protein ZipA